MAEVKSFAVEVNPKFLTTLKYKFNKEEYMSVATIDLSNLSNVWADFDNKVSEKTFL